MRQLFPNRVLVSDLPADHISVKLRVTEKLCPIDLSNFQIYIYIYYIYIYIYIYINVGVECTLA